jgi:hypothetical protein
LALTKIDFSGGAGEIVRELFSGEDRIEKQVWYARSMSSV